MFLLQLILYLVSKFLITISFNILYIYSAEMFPTELRLSLCGFASMFGRVGSMLAPQTLLLVKIRKFCQKFDILKKKIIKIVSSVAERRSGGARSSIVIWWHFHDSWRISYDISRNAQ